MSKTKAIAKERTIYDNYDPEEVYSDETIIEMARECEWVAEDEEVTDSMIWSWRDEQMEMDWEDTKEALSEFWEGKTAVILGTVGVWHGTYKIKAEEGKWWTLFERAIKDCDYIKLWDENGHFYLRCSHHDGTHKFEFKVKPEGKRYLTLPRYAEKVWGSPVRQYEKPTKENMKRALVNIASSQYSA